jgi:hypothetical protein
MSYQFESNCYSDALSAVQAVASSRIGQLVQIGTTVYSVDVTSFNSSSISYKLQDLNSSAFITKTVLVTPQSCGLLDTSDGLIIGWGIAAAWLLTYAVLFIRRGVHE